MIKFYDTKGLLNLQREAFKNEFVISDVTLKELEDIRDSANKSDDLKHDATQLSQLLDEYVDKYKVITSNDSIIGLDMKIIDCACSFSKNHK